jgi:hypothetical protein
MQFLPSFGVIAGALLAAYLLGAIVWVLCWAVISRFLEKRPCLSSWLRRWSLLRWIAAVASAQIAASDDSARFLERVHDRGIPWRERLGWKRVARQTLCFTAAGFLILAAFYMWGAYKRSVQWYAIEPPPDISGGIKGPLRPDSDAWLTEWTVKGVFWSKAACLHGIRNEVEALSSGSGRMEDEVRSFVDAQRCIAANSPYAPAPESDDWEAPNDSGD